MVYGVKGLLVSILFMGACAPARPLSKAPAGLGSENQPCQTRADCNDGYSCTGNGVCTAECLQRSCGSDADCCHGDYCAAGRCAATVDLTLTVDRPAVSPGDNDVVAAFTIGNVGASTRGKVALTFATPTYVNVSRALPLPAGCVFKYENLDITVPEIVRCELGGVRHGEQITLSFHFTVSEKAPPAIINGVAIVLPVKDSPDKELALVDNIVFSSMNVARIGTPAGGNVNLFVSYFMPAVGGPLLATQDFTVGNNGRTPTTGPVTLTATTPFFTNIDRTRPLPDGCQFLFQDPAPDIPEIVRCTVPAGLGPGSPRSFSLPIAPVGGGPIGVDPANAAVAVGADSSDVDSDRTDNFMFSGVLNLSPQPFFANSGTRESIVFWPASPAAPLPREMPKMIARGARLGAGAAVDLNVGYGGVVAARGQSAVQTFRIGNRGADATGDLRLVYVLPPFVNIDRGSPLPGACEFLHEDRDFTVPEIVACTLPALKRGATLSVGIPLAIAPNAPALRISGQVIVMPAPGSADQEIFIGDNLVRPPVTVLFDADAPPPRPGGNAVDLYATGDWPNVLAGGTATVHFRIGNKGPRATQGKTRFTFNTPMFVNIDRTRSLPDGCQIIYGNPDPTVPEIVDCWLPAGLKPKSTTEIAVPIVLLPGGKTGQLNGAHVVRPASSRDVERDLADNTTIFGVIASTPAP